MNTGGETDAPEKLGLKAAIDLLYRFGWELQTGLFQSSRRFECVQQEIHMKENSSNQHPTDLVFGYEDPTNHKTTAILSDVKGYKKASLQNKAAILGSIRSLFHTSSCAELSGEWKENFFPQAVPVVKGLLFTYNTDGQYKKEFETEIVNWLQREAESTAETKADKNRFLYVFGPQRVKFLRSLANDLAKANSEYADAAPKFLYFNNEGKCVIDRVAKVATVEKLLEPWISIEFKTRNNLPSHINYKNRQIWVYYNGALEEPEEFEYILDQCFRGNLVDKNCDIRIKATTDEKIATKNLEVAKHKFKTEKFYGVKDAQLVLDRFHFQYLSEPEPLKETE